MIKILYVFGGEKASGAEIVIERLMSINKSNIQSHLFIAPGSFADKLLKEQKPYVINTVNNLKKLNRSNTSFFSFFFAALRNYTFMFLYTLKYIKKHKINIVHANTIVPASYLVLVVIYYKLFNRKVKFVWSDHDLKYYSKIDNTISKFCCFLYDATLVVSEAVKKKYLTTKKVFVLYNGLDTTIYNVNAEAQNRFRKLHAINDNIIVVGIPAVIAPRKGQLMLMKTFKKLNTGKENILIMAGKFAEDYPDYQQQVQEDLINYEHVNYIGPVNNMIEFYNGCDIIVNNSSEIGSEPLGTTIYEAMACEKIVVASRTGGTPEIIDHMINGYIFEADDSEGLKNILMHVINNYQTLNNVRVQARQKVISNFNIKKWRGIT